MISLKDSRVQPGKRDQGLVSTGWLSCVNTLKIVRSEQGAYTQCGTYNVIPQCQLCPQPRDPQPQSAISIAVLSS